MIDQIKRIFPLGVFVLAMTASPLQHLQWLKLMPGDMDDAALNNYFLENVYQFVTGRVDSLWNLGFFYPFPFVLGFSDNLFGSAPLYIFFRFLTVDSYTSFQLWFLFGYVLNFFAAYAALRLLKLGSVAASVGALIFAFALPTTAQAEHAQLHFRFAIPLALAYFVRFLETREPAKFVISGAWLVWQFYAGVYMGFFALLLIGVTGLVYLVSTPRFEPAGFRPTLREFLDAWRGQRALQKTMQAAALITLTAALAWLFYPYVRVQELYGATRPWAEISSMLPRIQSFFLSDASLIWGSYSHTLGQAIPTFRRHEHQMFAGAVPLILFFVGLSIGFRSLNRLRFLLFVGMALVPIVLTLYIANLSAWFFLHHLPLASAIRAMTRVDQALLFPIGYFAAVAVDCILRDRRWAGGLVVFGALILMVTEFSATTMATTQKSQWRERHAQLNATVPSNLPKGSILFFAQSPLPATVDETNAMWVALRHGVSTLNGYSGWQPPAADIEFGKECIEWPKRLMSYLRFINEDGNTILYQELSRRVVPIGFDNCDPALIDTMPKITSIDRDYSLEEVRNLSLRFEAIVEQGGRKRVGLNLLNNGNTDLSAVSAVGHPLRLSWRFLNVDGTPRTSWDMTRKDITLDVPAHSEAQIVIDIAPDMEVAGGTLEVSIVQESVFWAHEIGVEPLRIPWD